jgi:hypothetical protein
MTKTAIRDWLTIVGLAAALVALVMTIYLGERAIVLSNRASSDSEESMDLVGVRVLADSLKGFEFDTLASCDRPLGRRIVEAVSLLKAGDTMTAESVLIAADTTATGATNPHLHGLLGLKLADLGMKLHDDTFLLRRALKHYELALRNRRRLGINATLYVRSLRWWARAHLGEIPAPLPKTDVVLVLLCCVSGLVVLVGALIMAQYLRLKRR